MIYGYIRVSTKKQDVDNQRYEILKFAQAKKFKIDEFIEEAISGTKSYKVRKLGDLIERLKKGDTIIISELSRFGRSLLEVMEILNQLMLIDVKIFVVKRNMELGQNIQSKVLAFAFGLSAEIERELISSRTKEALEKKKSEGYKLGRPKGSTSKSKLDGRENEIDKYLAKSISISSICKLLDVAPTTFYNFCKTRKIDIKKYK
jgi:DNA invertase Pin-like site-specific DNA recombinase